MLTHNPILVLSVTAAADLTQNRFIGLDGDVCGAGAKALGVAEMDAAAGEQATANVQGCILIEAGGAIAAGAEVESNASGQAITQSSGTGNGYALDAATSAGDVIRIIRGI